MAKFILGNALRKKALDNSVLRHTLWLLDLLVIGLLYSLFRLLPVTWASRTGDWLGRRIGPWFRSRCDHMRANLGLAFPDKSPQEIEQLLPEIWGNAGAVLGEYPHLARIVDPRHDHLELVFEHEIPTYSDPTQPAVFVTAHIANWEAAGAALYRYRVPLSVLYSPLANPWLDRLLRRSRLALGCELISREASMRPFVQALKEGRSVAMIMDRRIEAGTPIPFFGADKPSSTLAARLALKFGCPLVPVELERREGPRFTITFHEPLLPANPDADAETQARDLTRQIHRHFEQWITQRPGAWFCSKKIWSSAILRAHRGGNVTLSTASEQRTDHR
ncbi:lysophospholipid acyltransferase family protein [Thiohalobacter thiocyanaticus]|uniref:Lauroyl acyltransferase n=1 Tax=Thiohalobacter thiocyanaticus TaxID=585455 RepID=A0A426QGZ5_9GAMM|nr:lauroyl acyltransferase [Thiohalobacter thiocyanaticus]RRQ21038.1 lauroyl acyltransferase [Thiohalobacter thiocyanaticus]